MGIKVFDFNNDGRMDIFITDMHSDMSEPTGPEFDKVKSEMKWPVSFRGTGKTSIWGNSFFLKDGPGKFHEASDALGAENYCPWGPSIGDLNADGFDDAFITAGMNYPERYMINSVKLNDRGQKFVDAEFALGVEPRSGGIATPWFDLDASGKDRTHPDAAGETGLVQIWGARGSRSAVIFDVDGDGDLDVVTNEFNAAPMVLVSNLTEKTKVHYVAVKLTGTTSNRNGLGAVVRVTAGGYDLHESLRRQLRLPLTQLVSAVFRAWRRGFRQRARSDMAVGEDADCSGADQDEFGPRGSRAVGCQALLGRSA